MINTLVKNRDSLPVRQLVVGCIYCVVRTRSVRDNDKRDDFAREGKSCVWYERVAKL